MLAILPEEGGGAGRGWGGDFSLCWGGDDGGGGEDRMLEKVEVRAERQEQQPSPPYPPASNQPRPGSSAGLGVKS